MKTQLHKRSEKVKSKDLKKIEKAIMLLNEAIFDIQEYIPQANFFVNGESRTSLHLMLKEYGDESEHREWADSSYADFEIYNCDCGGF